MNIALTHMKVVFHVRGEQPERRWQISPQGVYTNGNFEADCRAVAFLFEGYHLDDIVRQILSALIDSACYTTKTYRSNVTLEGRPLWIVPTAIYCYTVGRNITATLDVVPDGKQVAIAS